MALVWDATQFFSAHKIWARDRNIIVALIADLQAKHVDRVFTALDQSRWQGKVTVNKPGNILQAGSHKLNNVRRIHHKNFAYIPLYPSSFRIRLNRITGK